MEIKMPEKDKEVNVSNEQHVPEVHAPSSEVAIDIGQVLAANQALLKNMARKMEKLENKLEKMEQAYREQSLLLSMEKKKFLMLEAPTPQIKPWSPNSENLDEIYFRKFSLADRLFRPWKMRRKNCNS